MAGENVLVIDDSPTLLRIVARTLSRAGYKVRTAEGGAKGVTLAKAERPDLIVLDYLMPPLNGDQVCRMLGHDPTLRDVPVVVMSAKGEKVGPRLVDELGAVDYISKPFSPEALMAVTSHVVAKYVREGTPPPRLSPDAEEPQKDKPRTEAPSRASRLDEVRSKLGNLLGPAIEESLRGLAPDSGPDARSAALAHSIGHALSGEQLASITQDLVAITPEDGLSPEIVLIGDLEAIPVADVLQMLQFQKQTGIFVLSRGDLRVQVFFWEGRADWVGGRNLREEFLLGRFIVDRGAISRQDLDLFLQSRSGSRKLLGAQLVKLGYINPEDLSAALRQQSSEIIYEVLRWTSGRFYFTATDDRPAHVEEARLGLALEKLLMEGFRRVDEWSMIEKVIHSFDIVFQRNEDAIADFGLDSLQEAELFILDLVDGENSVRQIVQTSRMGSFEVCKMLYRLLSARLIRKRVEPAPPEVMQA